MYHVVIIGIIFLILYFLTLGASKFSIITRRGHMAFWNTILIITFLVAASAGIFLALQSNYQWEIESVEKILNWHVDFGIAMSFTAIIHLTWNLPYYKRIFAISGKKNTGLTIDEVSGEPFFNYRIMLLILGFISGAVQVIFLREILNLSGGYEIAAGAVFAFWIFISALGAKIAGKNKKANLSGLTAILPLGSIISLLIFIILSKVLIEEGVTPGIIYTLVITGLSLLPFCFLSGFLFVKLSFYASRETHLLPGNSFALETTGSMIAGIIVTLVTGNILGNFQILVLAIILYYIVYLIAGRFRYFRLLTGVAVLCLFTVIIFKPDIYLRKLLLGGVKVIQSIDSKYGNVAITEYKGSQSIFYNHRLIDFEQDEKQTEENIHYAMAQSEEPEDILIISGGADKHIREALKYRSVKSISYLERDPVLIACTRDTSIKYNGAGVVFINDDAFSYIRRRKKKFDVIISLLSEPENIVTNRFYTREYFEDVKRILNDGGIFLLKTGGSGSYISEEETGSLSAIYNSLDEVFSNILPIRGESLYLISSDNMLTANIPDLIEDHGIETTYVNSFYLNKQIIEFNSDQVKGLIDNLMPGNILDKPRAVFYKQKHQLKKAGRHRMPFLFLICFLLLLPFLTGSNSSRTMYSASLNLAATEILALILIQSTAGNFYQLSGLLIAVVMAGLAIGSSSALKTSPWLTETITVMLGILALLFALITPLILDIQIGTLPAILSLLIVIIPAVMAGYYYRRKTGEEVSSKLISGIYFADMCGAALGFMIMAGILVPLCGIRSTFIILAFFNFASYITNRLVSGIKKLGQQ
ncbi:MAG: hypothetical protein RQ743_04285 [Bacteroidales bacterium]|nr:hypothetical protein [Bacteroidales bacterium]